MDPAYGGPCQGVRNSTPELIAAGCQVEVVSLDHPEAPFLGKDPFPVHAVGPAKGPWGYGPQLPEWLAKHLHGFDAVVCHGLWQYPLLAVRRQIHRLRAKGRAPGFYVYPHGMLDPWFQRDPSRRLKALRNEIYWRLFERNNLGAADAVLFTCEEERRLAATTFPGYRVREKVVGYGISAPLQRSPSMDEAFRQAVEGLPDQTPYLLFLSRVHPKKGVDLLIRAYARLAKDLGPESRDEILPALVIAGPLDSAYANEMRRLATDSLQEVSRTDARILFTGMLQGDAKWSALYGAEAFVLPSHQENFGIAVVEAMACATPVLISDKVNIWREIADAGGGLVADDTESGTLDLLRRWMKLPDAERSAMSANARKGYEGHFASGPAARRLMEFLEGDRHMQVSEDR